MSPHRSCALDAAATALGTRICTIKPCIEYGTCTICTLHLYSRAGSFLTELSHTHTCRRRNCFVVLYSTCIVMHRNVDLLTGGDSDWPRRGVREFATPGRNRKREQHVGGHKREGDEEESSPCTGPCKTTTSVRSVPLLQYNTTRRVGM